MKINRGSEDDRRGGKKQTPLILKVELNYILHHAKDVNFLLYFLCLLWISGVERSFCLQLSAKVKDGRTEKGGGIRNVKKGTELK